MGKMVTFWSPYKGHGKTTSSLCAIVSSFMLQYPDLRVAVSYTEKDSLVLPQKLYNPEMLFGQKEMFENFGIDALKLYIRQRELSEEIIERYGIPLQMKSLYLYPNTQGEVGDGKLIFNILTEQLKRVFDVVFLDLESGNRKIAVSYMKKADLAVVVLPQDPLYLEKFIREEEELLKMINFGVVFGGGFENSNFNCPYYKKILGKKYGKMIIGEIYQNVGFFEAMSAGKTLDYFWRNQMAIKKEENYGFICQAKKTAENIGKKIVLA